MSDRFVDRNVILLIRGYSSLRYYETNLAQVTSFYMNIQAPMLADAFRDVYYPKASC
jgi:hypothetical protein